MFTARPGGRLLSLSGPEPRVGYSGSVFPFSSAVLLPQRAQFRCRHSLHHELIERAAREFSNPVCKVKFFNENNERCRYLTDDEWDRLQAAAPEHEDHSAHLLDKMILARNTGLRRANLFRAQWSWIDWMNRVIRVPQTKNNKAHAVPLNATAYDTFRRLYAARDPELDSAYVFCHARDTKHAGKPVLDVKNAFHAALRTARIVDFTWHDFRHDFASRLVMAGVSLRAVTELLGHKGLRMVMRYATCLPAT